MLKIKKLKEKLFITVVIALFAIALYIFSLPCPIYHFLKIPCFGCGMSRALIAVFQFDFGKAISNHIMVFSLPLLYSCFLLDGKLFRKRWQNAIFYSLVALGFLINWIRHIL